MQTQQRFAMPRDLAKAIDEVDRALAADNNGVVLDFSACEFISVDGLEWLEELLLRSESYNAPVNFVNVPPKLYKVFKVAKIDSVLKACGGAANQGPAC
ncbi:MAG: STAS domain-containing protein [Candidatus Obscuribacterales bacterium]